MTPDNDLDRAAWLNGEEAPECVECGDPTTRMDEHGVPIHAGCEENRNEEAYERGLGDFYGGSSSQTDAERMSAAYDVNRRQR
jgi:hypothetical protein